MLALNRQISEEDVEVNLPSAVFKLDFLELLPAVAHMSTLPGSSNVVPRLFHLDSNVSLSSNNQQVDADVVNGEIDFSAFYFFQQFFSDNPFSWLKTPEITNRQCQSQLKIVKSAIIRLPFSMVQKSAKFEIALSH